MVPAPTGLRLIPGYAGTEQRGSGESTGWTVSGKAVSLLMLPHALKQARAARSCGGPDGQLCGPCGQCSPCVRPLRLVCSRSHHRQQVRDRTWLGSRPRRQAVMESAAGRGVLTPPRPQLPAQRENTTTTYLIFSVTCGIPASVCETARSHTESGGNDNFAIFARLKGISPMSAYF